MQDLVNKLIKVTSYRGMPRNRICRVVHVRDTNANAIKSRSYWRKRILRSRYLLTVHDLGLNVLRSYYHEYVKFKQLGWLRGLWARLCRWLDKN